MKGRESIWPGSLSCQICFSVARHYGPPARPPAPPTEPAGRNRLAPFYGDSGRHALRQFWQLRLPGEIDSRPFMVIQVATR